MEQILTHTGGTINQVFRPFLIEQISLRRRRMSLKRGLEVVQIL
jgi:hypothetical protein